MAGIAEGGRATAIGRDAISLAGSFLIRHEWRVVCMFLFDMKLDGVLAAIVTTEGARSVSHFVVVAAGDVKKWQIS